MNSESVNSIVSSGERNLFRSLVAKLIEREGTKGGLLGLSEILAGILSNLVRELTGQCKHVGVEHARSCHGTFLQAQEALGLLLESGKYPIGPGAGNRKLKELSRRFELELGQVCRYGNTGQQQLYRAELKSMLHRLLDTVTSILSID